MSDTKTCSCCKEVLPISSFSKKKKSSDGLQYNCKACAKQLNSKHYQEHKTEIKSKVFKRKVAVQKIVRSFVLDALSSGCIDCKEKDPVVLEFDHVKSNKSYNVSDLIVGGYSLEKVASEIEKCVVRCANCHKKRTAKQFGWYKLYTNKKVSN